MKTAHLQEAAPIASAKVGNPVVVVNNYHSRKIKSINILPNVKVESYEPVKLITELIDVVYHDNEQYIKDLFTFIYGYMPTFQKDSLLDIIGKVTALEKAANCSIEEVILQIRNRLHYPTMFHREKGGKLIPISSERILNAYRAVKAGKPRREIENILYL